MKTATQQVRESAQGWRGESIRGMRCDRMAERVLAIFLVIVGMWFFGECARTIAVSGWSFLLSGGAQ